MRKNIVFYALILILVLCSCSCGYQFEGGTSFPEIDRKITATVKMTDGKFNATGTFIRTYENEWEVTMTEPYELSGLCMKYCAGKITLVYDDLTLELPAQTDKYTLYATLFIEQTEAFISSDELVVTRGTGTISAALPDGSAILTADEKTQTLLNLKKGSFDAVFSDVSLEDIKEREAEIEE